MEDITKLKNEMKELKEYIEEVFGDQNDINDDTRMQLELINQTLAELQVKDQNLRNRRQIGYKLPRDVMMINDSIHEIPNGKPY